MEIEYAYFLKKEDRANHINKFVKYTKKRKEKSIRFIAEHKELIKEYIDSLFETYQLEVENKKQDIEGKIESYKSILEHIKNKSLNCSCGASMKFISSHGFWGCVSYQDKSKEHITFNNSNDYEFYIESCLDLISDLNVKIPKQWISTVRVHFGIKDLSLKETLNEFNNNGIRDLYFDFYGIETISLSKDKNTLSDTKKRTDNEEHIIQEYLSGVFKNIVSQSIIKYKIKEDKERICKPDLICSCENYVNIFEIKTDRNAIDRKQLNIYDSLIRHMMKNKGDDRVLNSLFLIYDDKWCYNKDTREFAISFDELKDMSSNANELGYEISEFIKLKSTL